MFYCDFHGFHSEILLTFLCKGGTGGGGGGGGGGGAEVFLNIFQEDKASTPDVFSSCSFITCTHFETSSVMVSFYGYEI